MILVNFGVILMGLYWTITFFIATLVCLVLTKIRFFSIMKHQYPIIFEGVTERKEKLKQDMNTSLGFLNQFLSAKKWVAAENPTIADTAIMATLSTILEIGWDITQFPNIQRWYKDCIILPGYKENLEGAKAFAALVNQVILKNNLK